MASLVIEYVWLGGDKELRSKHVLFNDIENFKGLESVPEWNDGSSIIGFRR